MSQLTAGEKRVLQIMLILVTIGLACLLYSMQGYKMVILHLFFLPVVLGGFFLGRYHAGVLALFCVISASLAADLDFAGLSAAASPLVIALAITVWAAVLGLTALLVGTLSDERTARTKELHEAYVGVVEVLAQYLQSAHQRLKAWSTRVAELSQAVAMTMKLPPRQIDDIRVAALLYDLGNIEVTTRVIRRAVGMFEDDNSHTHKSTFQGMDLMLSLSSVLSGAVPLLLNQEESMAQPEHAERRTLPAEIPIGAKIIRAVRAYLTLTEGAASGSTLSRAEILKRLRSDGEASHDPEILAALENALAGPGRGWLPLVEDATAPVTDGPAVPV